VIDGRRGPPRPAGQSFATGAEVDPLLTRRNKKPQAIRACGCALFALAFAALAAQTGSGTLHVEIRDESGRVTPAMVCITSLEDNKWRTPPDGAIVPPYTRVPDFMDPEEWKPGDIGPVRLTVGDWRDNNTRSFLYGDKSGYPFWAEPAAYFVAQPFSIQLPAGRWRLAVARGIEYLPVFEEFAIKPGEVRKRRIDLRRWEHMARRGWYAGDDHVHFPRTKPWHNEFLLTWARAEEVYVSTTLQQRTLRALTFPQGEPEKFRFQQGEYVLQAGQEDPSTAINELGHTLALNIKKPVFDLSRFHLYDVMFDAVRAQGGLTGYAHIAWAPDWYRRTDSRRYATWDSTINVIQGRLDFFEIMQFRLLGLEDYYDFLSMGIKLTASAGSDMPWASSLGESRVYVYTGRPFSADRWFQAFKQGRTFVTNGPMLSLTVNGAGPGEEVKVGRATSLRIRARAWAPPAMGSPKTLEIISHGAVIHSAASPDPSRHELHADLNLPADQSRWIAARVTTHNNGLAHTSPVYVLVNGETFWNRDELAALVSKRLAILDYGESRLKEPKYTAAFAPGEVDALRQRIQAARMRYRELLSRRQAASPAPETGHSRSASGVPPQPAGVRVAVAR
jgi:hypothetical protein